MVYVIMGVSGSGKTTVGKKLAEKLEMPFFDADDYHPTSNVRKMKSGQPLTDEDRKPWLDGLHDHISEWNSGVGAVLACSALKKSYRDILMGSSNNIRFVYLKGKKEIIQNRMENRKHHYMPPSLLESQFETLEEPENAITVSIENSPDEIVKNILMKL